MCLNQWDVSKCDPSRGLKGNLAIVLVLDLSSCLPFDKAMPKLVHRSLEVDEIHTEQIQVIPAKTGIDWNSKSHLGDFHLTPEIYVIIIQQILTFVCP
jgi:hypothetical protein